MKISTKARYGLRALIDLAVHTTGEQVPLAYIAARQELSVNYLEQVFSLLKKAGIVRSVKGSQGGYILVKRPDEITVGQVIRAIEGEISIVEDDLPTGNSLLYDNLQQCLKERVWEPINQSICEVIDHITLEQLVRDYQILGQENAGMYYI
nr:Rrf2 family transcriptional regulator [uncultured Cellulosilyticum sp.]